MRKAFKKILIANRGEIAVRVIRACREMGIIPAVVYSEADRKALHVRLAGEGYFIGKADPAESYLNIDKIIDTAKKCHADAIHPGYGFLAEDSRFVSRCEEEGLAFIGPPSSAMEAMSRKTASRRIMADAGVPIIPGTLEPLKSRKMLLEKANEVGYPLLLKAAAGGGGKGLRLVREPGELESAFRMARSEALSSFGDDAVYMERYIEEPHHIEIQVLADHFGKCVWLGERECSIQRRYQKVMEEAPSPFLDEATRAEMGHVAVRAAQAVGYRNAGTIEFVVDKNRNFFFLEMNTRLQVEHPVTEMITGIDLVKNQIRIAEGQPLSFSQQDIQITGASIQCRIYAEDPYNDFLPSPGKILYLRSPTGGLGLRYDNGTYQGYEVPLEYDPLLSKLISWGATREEAIQRMLRALSEYHVYGIKTTIPFFKRILQHPMFISGDYNTHFIAHLEKEEEPIDPDELEAALIAAGIKCYREGQAAFISGTGKRHSRWKHSGRSDALS